jgi:hypothetical protein
VSVLNSALGSPAWSQGPDVQERGDSANETPPSTQVPPALRMSSGGRPRTLADAPTSRIRAAHVEWVRERLTQRD